VLGVESNFGRMNLLSNPTAVLAAAMTILSSKVTFGPLNIGRSFWFNRWPPDGIDTGVGPFLGDKDTEPTEQGVRRDDGSHLAESAASHDLSFSSWSDALGIGEALGFASQLFEEHAVQHVASGSRDAIRTTHGYCLGAG